MATNRREFIGATGLGILTLAMRGAADAAAPANPDPDAWHQRIKRITQINFSERDAERFDVEAWIDYLVATRAECTFVSITNMVAFYPTDLPDLPRSRWLGNGDLVGACVEAARARGIRIMGRLSPDMAQSVLAERHPEWFRRDAEGDLMPLVTSFSSGAPDDPSSGPGFARTCPMTSYYDEFLPKVIDEVMERYPLDGLYTNGWPGNRVPQCYCGTCLDIAAPGSEDYRRAYQRRTEELWTLFDEAMRARRSDAVFSGNLGGRVAGGELDLQSLMSRAIWMFADQQGRHGAFAPSWDASQQTRVSRALADGRPAVVSTAAWTLLSPTGWRPVSGNPHEIRTRLYQTLASGGTMHLHWLGFDQGFREDRRWQTVGREVMSWQADNDAHFHNTRSLADVAVLVSPESNRLYEAPPGTEKEDAYNGMYRILNEQRVPFDVILDRALTEDGLAPYRVLVLPNVAVLGDAQAAAVRAFAARGGSVIATFETGVYDAAGALRPDFALADVFGISRTGERHGFGTEGGNGIRRMPGAVSMQRIERPHPLLAAFQETHWIAGSSWRMPMSVRQAPLLTDIPQHAVYPVEAVFPEQERTTIPTISVQETGEARHVYLAEDIDGGYWRTGERDLGELLAGALRWVTGGRLPFRVEGRGLLEVSGWRTEPGYAVHLVNHTNPNFRGGALRGSYPVGPQDVTLALDGGQALRSARLLMRGTEVPFRQNGAVVEATVPEVNEYEVLVFQY